MHDLDDLRESREAELGYSEVSARELRLRDWEATRVDENFERLVKRLRSRKWIRDVYAEGGPRLEEVRRKSREWVAAKRVSDPTFRARHNEIRRGHRRKAPVICRCIECGATWCRVVWVRGIQPTFCSQACSKRYRYHRRALAEGKTTRRAGGWAHLGDGLGLVGGAKVTNAAATVRARVLGELARRDGLPCAEARALCAEIVEHTYRDAMWRLKRDGVLVVEGVGSRAVYRLPARGAGGGRE